MANRTNIPVIFLACANSYKAGRRLAYLVRERRRIASILALEEEKGHVQVIQEGNTSKDFFFDELRQRRYKNRVAIIHFAGHADGATLRFESEEGQEEEMNIETLAEFLGTIKGLHLVFLNGCGTAPIVRELLRGGIPVVIATQTQIEDRQAAKVAEEFYQGIAGGYSIEESFAQAKAIAKSGFGFHKLQKSDITRALYWQDNPEPEAEPEFPWGLYTLEGQEEHLNWHLETQAPAGKTTRERPWYLRAEGILGLLSLLVAIVFGVLELSDKRSDPNNPIDDPNISVVDPVDPNPSGLSLAERINRLDRKPGFFGGNREETYNVLLIPFQKLSQDVSSVEGYVKSRLRGLSGESGLPLDIQIRDLSADLDLDNELLNVEDARKLGGKYGADMVVWGKYFYDNAEANQIKLDVSTGTAVNRFNEEELVALIQEQHSNRPFPTFSYPDYLNYTHIIHDVEDVVFWARGNEQIKEGNYEDALSYLEQIEGSYVPVHLQFANCYEALADESTGNAKSRYFALLVSRMDSVASSPNNAAYHYYQGLLYDLYGTGHFKGTQRARAKSANAHYGRSLDLDPDFLKSYFRRGRLFQYELSVFNKNQAQVYYDSALQDYNAYIQRNNQFAYVYHDRGRLYHYHLINSVSGAVDSALGSYSRAIALEPEFVYAYEDRGRLYQTYLGNDALAKADFDRAIRYGGTAYSYFYRGLLHQDQGENGRALSDYSKALAFSQSLSENPFFKEKIYAESLVSQPLSEGEQSVYSQLAKIYEKDPSDSLLFLKNAQIMLERERTSNERLDPRLKRRATQKLRSSGRLSGN